MLEFLKTSHVGSEGICRLNRSLSLLNKQEGLANISKHLRLTTSKSKEQRGRKMERWEATLFTSSQEENTIAEFYNLIMVWWSDTALRHLLTAYHQYATMMTKHQRQHSTAQHRVTTPWWLCGFLSVHSRTKLFRFDCHWSVVLPIHRQVAYTYKWITATWRFLFVRLPWMTEYFTLEEL